MRSTSAVDICNSCTTYFAILTDTGVRTAEIKPVKDIASPSGRSKYKKKTAKSEGIPLYPSLVCLACSLTLKSAQPIHYRPTVA